jgi:predicted RNase H-like nuclease
MPTFIGLDLAWGSKNESGVCVLRTVGDELRCSSLDAIVGTPDSFSAFAASYGAGTVVAVDAPLIVSEGRMAERELGRVFGKYKAGAYLATSAWLERMGGMAGPNLGIALRGRGFSLDPAAIGTSTPVAIEVYPHAAHVVLFGLAERIKYKKGTLAQKREGIHALQEHLRVLLKPHRAVLDAAGVHAALAPVNSTVGGGALKHLEDKLDAMTCAYVAYHAWTHGSAGIRVFGDAESGYILVPWRDGFV